MKIAMASASAVPSTTANSMQVMKTAQAAANQGHQVLLLLPGNHPAPFEALAKNYGLNTPFEIEWLPSPRIWRRYDLAWKALRRAHAWQADLIYTWMPQAAVLALWQRFPTVLEMHDLPTGKLGPQIFRLFWRATGKKRMLAITRALLERLHNTYHFLAQPGETILAPNGVDLERYAGLPEPTAARKALGLSEVFTAVYSGHFYSGRGMDLLCTLAQRCPDIQFLWVGGTDEAVRNWRSQLEELSIHNITLTGFIPNLDLPQYQAAADVLLMPYERHIAGSSGGDSAAIASPMKAFEYLACGRAILSSDLSVIREILNEKNAVLCPPGDADAWQAALCRLQADTGLRASLVRQARLDAAGYTWDERARRALAGF